MTLWKDNEEELQKITIKLTENFPFFVKIYNIALLIYAFLRERISPVIKESINNLNFDTVVV